jgi:hypothetical protein
VNDFADMFAAAATPVLNGVFGDTITHTHTDADGTATVANVTARVGTLAAADNAGESRSDDIQHRVMVILAKADLAACYRRDMLTIAGTDYRVTDVDDTGAEWKLTAQRVTRHSATLRTRTT